MTAKYKALHDVLYSRFLNLRMHFVIPGFREKMLREHSLPEALQFILFDCCVYVLPAENLTGYNSVYITQGDFIAWLFIDKNHYILDTYSELPFKILANILIELDTRI